MFRITRLSMATASALAVMTGPASAFQFATGSIEGSFDSTLTAGFGVRASKQSCALIGDGNTSCGASANTAQYSNGDNGNLNYKRGDFFAANIKGTHELLLKMPDGYKFMARGTWLYDAGAPETRRTDLDDDAKRQVARDVRLLDFWASKDFTIGEQNARVRLGNQVLNWGESYYISGGINATNALDLQKLAVPGTQLKEAVIPAPMVSFATGLGHGVNLETYYQFRWNRNRVPPVGAYFSANDLYDKGRQPLFLNPSNFNVGGFDPRGTPQGAAASFASPVSGDDIEARKTGQYGLSLHYKPEGSDLDLGFYYLNYHDKSPVLQYNSAGIYNWRFLEDRELYGLSANFPLGDWAIGTELSYRPRDAVALTGCYNAGGPLDFNTNGAVVDTCSQWIDKEKYQFHVTAQLSISPSNYPGVLKALGGATNATFTTEAVVIRYPDLRSRFVRSANGVPVQQAPAAGYAFWTENSPSLGTIASAGGTGTSWGYVADFNAAYDGKIIDGWQVIPGVTYFQAVRGDTPTLTATFLEGAKSATYYVLFNKNDGKWNAGINYTAYWGGNALRQAYGDRDFVGGFLSYNF
ncbi:DUF1302 domain-containing protein [Aromatoleum evansii]|uniref:DUF1302 domain-containing protein n=1 Tax=Aromatoleum evansii TaxID=59406 RepID=UPI00145EE2F7|nr:DUF1302 domain-containing protein [Aromatoleum evansii]NMG30199.1 DUF1302 family protein [Aromatoleum evansii]